MPFHVVMKVLKIRGSTDFRNTILAQKGSRDALDIFIDFRNRKPKIDSLLDKMEFYK